MDKSKLAVSTYERIADIYTKQYFDDLSDNPYIDKFLSFLPIKSKVLEVGCGPGQFVKYLLDKGYQAEGIDLSEKMIGVAKNRVPQGKFQLMDMRKLKFRNSSFDGLMAPYSLIHIPSKEIPQTLRGFIRVLRPNGHILIIAQQGEADKIVNESLKEGEKMFINFFTKGRLSKFLEDVGFKIEYLEEIKSQDPSSMSDRIIYAIAKRL